MCPGINASEKATHKVLSYNTLWRISGPLIRNVTEIRLRGFLYQGAILKKKQPEVLKKWLLFRGSYCIANEEKL